MKYSLLLLCLALCLTAAAQTRKEKKEQREANKHFKQELYAGSIAQQNFTETVPFEYVHGKIYIKVQINGREYSLIFDTGAPIMLSTALINELHLPPVDSRWDSLSITDAASTQQKERIYSIDSLKIGHILFNGVSGMGWDMGDMTDNLCHHTDGIIGANLMRKCNWKIDFKNHLLTFSDQPVQPAPGSKAVRFLELPGGNPVVKMTGGDTSEYIEFDSGDDESFATSDSVLFVKLAGPVATGHGLTTQTAFGKTYERTYRTVARSFLLDSATFSGTILDYTHRFTKIMPTFGTAFMQEYDVWLDWQEHKIYFSDNHAVKDSSGYTSLGGIGFYRIDTMLQIVFLYEGSPAEKAGIRTGDQVVSFNSENTTHITAADNCRLYSEAKKLNTVNIVVRSAATGERKAYTLNRYGLFTTR